MLFHIDRGLFKLDFTDHHAILGIPVNADEKEVRKRYLKIARNLHPDSCKAGSESDKKHASELLSKLVNPAYEQLSRNHREYAVSLGLLGKRLAAERARVPMTSQAAKQLAQAGANIDNAYKSAINNLASKQYESLDQALDKIAEISELNMVYLMVKEGKGLTAQNVDRGGDPKKSQDGDDAKNITPPPPPPKEDAYIRRAKGYLEKGNYAAAVLELREALKLEPNNSNCHSLLGYAFLKQNQMAMAKVHINKALQLNPKDDTALKAKQYIEKLAQKGGGGTGTASVPAKPPQGKPTPGKPSQGKPSDKSGGGGLFGGLFGGKKK